MEADIGESGLADQSPLVFASDWLGSEPYFYNALTGCHGRSIWDAIDLSNIEIDTAGLGDYLRFGYSVFGATPIKNVKFLRPNQELYVNKNSNTVIQQNKRDVVSDWQETVTSTENAIDLFYQWHPASSETRILPLSGGLDSRMLLLNLLSNGDKPRCFTYGTSQRQVDSNEVSTARQVAEQADCEWSLVLLDSYHSEIDWWFEHFGPSVHLHGMYQVEFYRKLSSLLKGGLVVSGIVGDLWAGSISTFQPKSPHDLLAMGLTRGISVSEDTFLRNIRDSNMEREFSEVRGMLADPLQQIVYLIRTKMMLLSYMREVPKLFGFEVESPFLDPDIALSFSTIKQTDRDDRNWQRRHLRAAGYLKDSYNIGNSAVTMDLGQLARQGLHPLDESLLGKYIQPAFLRWVNSRVIQLPYRDRAWLFLTEQRRVLPSIGNLLRTNSTTKAYSAYMCLKPIENLLRIASQ